jgi:TPP-dependent trihydroxycyclohexane-1,2-dione (THcHDO) dehydratase
LRKDQHEKALQGARQREKNALLVIETGDHRRRLTGREQWPSLRVETLARRDRFQIAKALCEQGLDQTGAKSRERKEIGPG